MASTGLLPDEDERKINEPSAPRATSPSGDVAQNKTEENLKNSGLNPGIDDASGGADTPEQSDSQPAPSPEKSERSIGSTVKKHKGLLAFGGAGLLLAALFIAFFLFLLGFKLNHIRNLFISYHFARFHTAVAKRVNHLITQEAVLSAESVEKGGKLAPLGKRSLLDKLARLDPDEALRKLGNDSRFKLEFEEGRKWKIRKTNEFKGFRDVNNNIVTPDDPNFNSRLSASVEDVFQTKNKFFRSRLAKQVRDIAGIKRTWWKNKGEEYRGKTQAEIDELDRKKALQEIADPEKRPQSSLGEVNDQANELRKEVENGSTVPDAERALGNRTSTLTRIAKFSAFAGIATFACIFYDAFVKNVEKMLDYKMETAMRLAHSTLTQADEQKEDKTTAEAVDSALKPFEGFEDSAEAQRAMSVPVTGKELPEDAQPQKGLGLDPGPIDNILGPFKFALDKFCGPLLTPLGQVALVGLEAAATVGSAGTVKGGLTLFWEGIKASLPKLVAITGGTVVTTEIIIPKLVKSYAGLDVSGLEDSVQRTNAVGAGTELLAEESARLAGGHPLTPAEVIQANNEVRQLKLAERNNKSLRDRIASLEDADSLVSRLILATPTGPKALMAQVNSFLVGAFNPVQLAYSQAGLVSRSLTSQSSSAIAASGTSPNGTMRWGQGDVDRFNMRENIVVVEARLDELEKKYGKCYDGSVKMGAILNGKHKECTDTSELALRYGQYVFDTHIVENMDSLGSDEDDEGTAGAAPSGPSTSGGGGTLPTGTAAELTTQLRNNPKVVVAANLDGMDRDMLAVAVALSQEFSFTISSAKRGCFGWAGCASRHVLGKAMDFQLINGQGPSRATGYDQYIDDVVRFAERAGAYLPGPQCEIGLPNNRYVSTAAPKATQCKVFRDAPDTTGATAPHVHLAVPR